MSIAPILLSDAPASGYPAAETSRMPAMAQAAAAVADPAVAPAPLIANPSLHIDQALNLLVIEFHNAAGDLSLSIPNVKQLQAYRTGLAEYPGSQPRMAPAAAADPDATPRAATAAAAAYRTAPPVVA